MSGNEPTSVLMLFTHAQTTEYVSAVISLTITPVLVVAVDPQNPERASEASLDWPYVHSPRFSAKPTSDRVSACSGRPTKLV
jgi:hypothetical protein